MPERDSAGVHAAAAGKLHGKRGRPCWLTTSAGADHRGSGAFATGMTLDEMERVLGFSLSPWREGPYESDECWYTEPLEKSEPQVGYMMKKDRLVRIDIYDLDEGIAAVAPVRTDSGFAVGTSEESIIRHYGNELAKSVHPYIGTEGSYLRIGAADGLSALLFETSHGRVTRFRAGLVPAVDYIEGCS